MSQEQNPANTEQTKRHTNVTRKRVNLLYNMHILHNKKITERKKLQIATPIS